MGTYTINHELNQYDYAEGIEFNGLMPKLMEADGVDTTGTSDTNVKFFGFDAKGSDALEVIDIEALQEDESGNESNGGNEDNGGNENNGGSEDNGGENNGN